MSMEEGEEIIEVEMDASAAEGLDQDDGVGERENTLGDDREIVKGQGEELESKCFCLFIIYCQHSNICEHFFQMFSIRIF